MNYERIYSEFIADRLTKQPSSPEYFEKHHILPKCKGGLNGKENLIRLTPEDHLFAHIVLAKIYGGKLWVAVKAMENLANKKTKRTDALRLRVRFGFIRKALANHYREVLSGASGKIADKTIYTLHHFDGREACGNRFELEDATGVPRQQISAVLRGAKKNAYGWYCREHNPSGSTRSELISAGVKKDDVFTLYHTDGREWRGSKWDFAKAFGAKMLFQTEQGGCQGWHKTKTSADEYAGKRHAKCVANSKLRGSVAGSLNANADKTVYKFVVIETGEVVEATKWGARERFGVTSSGLCALFNGRQTKTRGISLADPVRAVAKN